MRGNNLRGKEQATFFSFFFLQLVTITIKEANIEMKCNHKEKDIMRNTHRFSRNGQDELSLMKKPNLVMTVSCNYATRNMTTLSVIFMT